MPASDRSRIYWDANVFLSLLGDDSDRMPVLESILNRVRASAGKEEIVTSSLSITEVAFGAEEQLGAPLDSEVEDRINALWDDPSTIKLRDFDRLIARDARQLIRSARERGWSLKPADAIHLATAKAVDAAEFNTYDERLDKFQAIAALIVRRPYSQQPLLL
jgi:predicted nucleic acid-binding protein